MRIRAFAVLLLVIVGGLWSATGYAGVITSQIADTCNGTAEGAVITSVQPYQGSLNNDKLVIHDSRKSGCPVGSCVAGGMDLCSVDTLIELRNDAEGPAIGTTVDATQFAQAEVKRLFADFGKVWRGGVQVWGNANATRTICREPPCDAFSVLKGSAVIALKDDMRTPAAVVIQTPGDLKEAGAFSIPISVVTTEDDAWLEISNRGRIFWKVPMSDLQAGRLYFASVPAEFLSEGTAVWTIYLNTSGAGGSTVYLPVPSDQVRY